VCFIFLDNISDGFAIEPRIVVEGRDIAAEQRVPRRLSMSTRSEKARLSPSLASEMFSEAAQALWVKFNAWYQTHPEATFDEMDSFLGEEGRGLLGKALQLILRQGDLGATPEGRHCERCGGEMVFKGYPGKVVEGLRVEAEIPRAYYICPRCEAGVFPPGPTSAAESGEVE
jgi:hypothetical protein